MNSCWDFVFHLIMLWWCGWIEYMGIRCCDIGAKADMLSYVVRWCRSSGLCTEQTTKGQTQTTLNAVNHGSLGLAITFSENTTSIRAVCPSIRVNLSAALTDWHRTACRFISLQAPHDYLYNYVCWCQAIRSRTMHIRRERCIRAPLHDHRRTVPGDNAYANSVNSEQQMSN